MTTTLIELRAIAQKLEKQPYHPNRELAMTLVKSAAEALSQVNSAKGVKDIRDKVLAFEHFFKLQGAQLIDSNLLVAQRIRTEHRLGGMLSETVNHSGGRKPKNDVSDTSFLPEGVTGHQSSKWQKLASIDLSDIESLMQEKINDDELSTAAILRWAFVAPPTETPELPTGIYNLFYADPPWEYGNSGLQEYGHAQYHYPTMSIDDLCNLPITKLADANAVLFLWVTSPQLEDSFRVIRAWGFEYKSSFVWDKVKHNFGYYNSVRHEFLLICTRGSFLPESAELFDSVVTVERSDEHSEKPEAFTTIIETMYPSAKKIELFARQKRKGWDAWGNQI